MKKFIPVRIVPLLLVMASTLANGQVQEIRLSMKDAVTLASVNNPEIKSSQKEIEKSLQQKVIARSLFLPSVSAAGSVNHFFQLTPFFGFGDNATTNKVPYGRFGGPDQLGAAVSVSQPLYNPAAIPAMQRARLVEQQSQVLRSSKEVEILSEVKLTYLKLLVLQQRIDLQQESILRNQRVLRDAGSLLIQGKGLRVDTLRAYTAVKNLEPELLKLTYASETNKLRLKSLIGLDSLRDIVLTDSLFFPDPASLPSEKEVLETALQNNPGILLLNVQQRMTDQQIRQASAAKMPVVSLAGQYQVQSQTRHFDYGSGYYPTSSYAGIQISVPLFTGFSNQAKIRQADIAGDQSALDVKNAHAQLRVLVHQSVADSRESLARLKTTASVQETAKLSYRIVQYRYEKGISSRLELTDAELSLSTAQSNYLEAVYDYLSADISLARLMGRAE